MRVLVDLASFMAMAFEKTGEKTLSFERLADLRDAADEGLRDLNAEIDWSRDSFRFAINFYRQFFTETEGSGVACSNREEMRKDMRLITDGVPDDVLEKLESCLPAGAREETPLFLSTVSADAGLGGCGGCRIVRPR